MQIQEESVRKQFIKMTQTPVEKLVITLGIPTTVSMLITNIYNMADTYFVSKISTSASGAIGVVFALMAIIQAFGFMFGHGAGSNISRHLGGKQFEDAGRYASTSFFLSIIFGVIIAVIGMFNMTQFMYMLGSTDTILPYSSTYAVYILVAAPALAVSCVMNNILRYEGMATYAMVGLTSGGVLNIFGDIFFMQVLHMGIAGAGLSTAIAQYISTFLLVLPFLLGKTQSKISIHNITCAPNVLWNIVSVGFPSMVRQGLGSISVMVLNQRAAVFGDAAIAAMSIVSRVINFLFCFGLGVGQGFQPVASFNYGAGKNKRVRKAFIFTAKFGTGVLAAFAVVGFFGAHMVVSFFRNDPEVVQIGATALRFQCISLIALPFSVCSNMLFQSIGKSGRATFLATMRSGLFFIPTVIILSNVMGLLGIELAQPVADVLSAIVSVPFVVVFFKQLIYEKQEN